MLVLKGGLSGNVTRAGMMLNKLIEALAAGLVGC
jgi:hypothetical protein